MSKESYARGFVKVAQAHGIDPIELAKFAQSRLEGFADWMDAQPAAKIDTKHVNGLTFGDVRRLHPEAAELDRHPALPALRDSLNRLNPEDARLDEPLTDARLSEFAKWLKGRPAAKINTNVARTPARSVTAGPVLARKTNPVVGKK